KDFGDIFSQERINTLPEHIKYNYRIDLILGSTPSFGPIYPISEKEQKVLCEFINEMKLERSTSSSSVPILFVPKPDGTLRLVIEYCRLNKITVKN
ncbi:unnamed protein product, partial [Tuber aestivum]